MERQGWLERDAENDYLALDTVDDDPFSALGHSITYRIALGPQVGRKVERLCRYVTASTCFLGLPDTGRR